MRHLVWILVLTLAGPARADVGPDAKDLKAVRDKGIAYLKKTQSADGSWSARAFGPGVTGVVVAALLRSGLGPDDPTVARGLAYLEKSVQKDGGIYDRRLANYTTSVALMAFIEANKNGKYDRVIKNARDFLKGVQHSADPKQVNYGGAGYDKGGRADMSNTQFMLDALLAAGIPKDDPAVQRALKFISRCQNLAGENNDQPFAAKATEADKGGFVYVPDPDDKQHSTTAGGLRSVGAMTYAGLKSFLYAGVEKKDVRVQGALRWIRRHYTLDENPGQKNAGLYYYYHTFAKALQALGEDLLEDEKKVKHDWRKDLFEALKKRQREDGSWVNTGDRTFGELDSNLATAFALLSMSYIPKEK